MKELDEKKEVFNWAKEPGWLNLISKYTEDDKLESLDEAILTEDKYKDIELGTCFKIVDKPAVYEILYIDSMQIDTPLGKRNIQVAHFLSYGHPTGRVWKSPVFYLNKYVQEGEFEIVNQDYLDKLKEY